MRILRKGYGMMPNEILYHEEISSSAKLLFVCISSHCAEKGYCWASNSYLAGKMGVTSRQIQRWLSELQGYLYIHKEDGEKRKIEFYPDDKEAWGMTKMSRGGDKKDTPLYIDNNNTNIINKSSDTFGGNEAPPIAPVPPKAELLLQTIIGIVNPKEKVTAHRVRVLNGRLKEYTEAEVVGAAHAFSKSEWHKEHKQMSIDNLIAPSKFDRWFTAGQDLKISPADDDFYAKADAKMEAEMAAFRRGEDIDKWREDHKND